MPLKRLPIGLSVSEEPALNAA